MQREVQRLMRILCDMGKVVSLETGGSLCCQEVDPRVRVILDIKCPGSGMEKKNLFDNLATLRLHDEVKFVLLDRNDFDYACKICETWKLYDLPMAPLFSPVHGKLDPKELVGWILEKKIAVRLNLQQHKYIWTPETMGV
jgi:7-carboxy-7-deazaguanine synthase